LATQTGDPEAHPGPPQARIVDTDYVVAWQLRPQGSQSIAQHPVRRAPHPVAPASRV